MKIQEFILLSLGLALLVFTDSVLSSPTNIWVSNFQRLGNPENTLYFGNRVEISFDGFDVPVFPICVIQIYDAQGPAVQAPLKEYLRASCKAGYFRFTLENYTPVEEIYFQVKATTRDGLTTLIGKNETVYSVSQNPDQSKREAFEELTKKHDYYTPYYRPSGGDVWVNGYPSILLANAMVTVNYTGIDTFDDCMIELVADDSSTLYVPCVGNVGFKTFQKVNMPASEFAFIAIVTYDNTSHEEVFYFTTYDSFAMEADL